MAACEEIPDAASGDALIVAAARRFALHHQLAQGADDDEEADFHLARCTEIARSLAAMPAVTLAGAAVKLFVDVVCEHGVPPGRRFGLHRPDGAPYGEALAWSAIADLQRLLHDGLPAEFRADGQR